MRSRATPWRTIANHALILEDDVYFRRPWSKLAPRIHRAVAQLPADWRVLYIGHVPLQAYFARPGIMRVRSFTTHAYLASPRMLAWLVENGPSSPDVVPLRFAGYGIDAAMANLPGMYAMFPMRHGSDFWAIDASILVSIIPASREPGATAIAGGIGFCSAAPMRRKQPRPCCRRFID